MCLSPTSYLHLESKKILSLLPDNTEIGQLKEMGMKRKEIVHILVFCTEKTGKTTT